MSGEESVNLINIAPLIGSVIVAIVLGVTLLINSFNMKNQSKVNSAKFYREFDAELRKTESELIMAGSAATPKIYHEMINVVITLNRILYLKEKIKLNFDIHYFDDWFAFGLGVTKHLKKWNSNIPSRDQAKVDEIIKWCKEKNIQPLDDDNLPYNITGEGFT